MSSIFSYRFEELFNLLPDGALVLDSVGKITQVNQIAARILDYSDISGLIGKTVNLLYVNTGDHDSLLSILGYRGVVEKSLFEWKKKGGETLLVELTASPLRDEKGHINGILVIFRDMTMKLENQLAQQASLEETAARSMNDERFLEAVNFYQFMPMTLILQGIAHNFNTPIGSIRGRAELICHQIEKNRPLLDRITGSFPEFQSFLNKQLKGLNDIIEQADRLVELTKNFTKRLSLEAENPSTQINLNEVIQHMLAFMESSLYFKHRITKEIHLHPELPPVDISYRAVSLALYHLLIHSMKATAGLNQKKIIIQTGFDEDSVWLEMTDNRERMDEDQLADLPLIRFSSRYPAPDEARFSLCDLEIANIRYLLSPYLADLEISSGEQTTFRLRISRYPDGN